ncbi:thrombin inhibitor rhodniin-like [Cydia amplana]|uniref:thrombin inhibitor rhodniin-like n=1 Tax=Cydia amplana TaxID=1869771 RepID=UPI002FE53DFC
MISSSELSVSERAGLIFGVLDVLTSDVSHVEQGCCDPTTCTDLVCGSNLKTYKCMCELECVDYYSDMFTESPVTSKMPLYKVHDGNCTPQPCDCPPDPTGPFCGNDTLTYFSECVLSCTNSTTFKVHEGPCKNGTDETTVRPF